MLLGVVLGVVVSPGFDGGESAGLRRVAQQDVSQQGDEQGHGGGEGEGADQEIQFLVRAVEPAAEPGGAVGGHRPDQGAAHVVRAVPDAHHRAALSRREPVRHHAAARGPAHAVEPADQAVEHPHHQDGQGLVFRADPLDRDDHEAHGDSREDEAQGQENAGVGTVAHAAHQELGQGVGGGVETQDESQLRLVETERGHSRDGHGEVLADEIESGVADEGPDEDLRAQALVSGIRLGAGLGRQVLRLLEELEHYLTVSMRMSG